MRLLFLPFTPLLVFKYESFQIKCRTPTNEFKKFTDRGVTVLTNRRVPLGRLRSRYKILVEETRRQSKSVVRENDGTIAVRSIAVSD